MGHSHSHGAGGHRAHAHICGGPDHHSGDYTPQQRADLDLVLEFNRRMAEAIDAGRDTAETVAFLDPDPLRYMWVDEGQGQIGRVITEAGEVLARAPHIQGHERRPVSLVEGATDATRPSVATGPDGTVLTCWLEWVPGRGDVVRASLARNGESSSETVREDIADVFRPTAAVATDGTPWVFYGATVEGRVGVWASRRTHSGWTAPEDVSGENGPAFNQEVVALSDGSLEVVWQARRGPRFEILRRRHDGSGWGETTSLTDDVDGNVWDPAVAALADGSTAYAWAEYLAGSYRVVVRRRDADGTLHAPNPVTGGSDYALHPSLAVTADQRLWCAFDLISVFGHGGSGPTKLRPASEVGVVDPEQVEGMREPGDSIPPELLPEVAASVVVVEVTPTGVRRSPGELAVGYNVVPSGMPKLVATADGGLSLAYRIHRQLPLMTYYWEVVTQTLGPDGWSVPATYAGTDGTLEEVGLAALPGGGSVLVAQSDGRLARALEWTEGFGGRECPYLLEHHGSVVWHGVHGLGAVVTATVASGGPVPDAGDAELALVSDVRQEARRWWTGETHERPELSVGDRSYRLYWGDLHRHSLVSRCTAGDEPSLEDFYRYSWDVCEYDFWAVTDHSENSSDYQWWTIQKIADLFHVPGRFVPFYGFEWTSPDSGHQNVIYGDVERGAPIFSSFASGTTDPAGLWAGLAEFPDYPAITIPHHPGSAMVYNDWDFNDPRYSRLVEIFQACRGNYESDGCFRQYSDGTRLGTFTLDGLLRGHRFGVIGSSDHGHGASYVGAYAEDLSRGSVFDALWSRRTFAATTRDVVLTMTLGSGADAVCMGEEAPAGTVPDLRVVATGYGDIARVDILRNGEVAHVVTGQPELPAGWVSAPVRVEWGGSHETTRWDGRLVVDGGARIEHTPYWSPEIVAASDTEVAWKCTTHSFGELYGAQRGCVELTLSGPPEASVTVTVGDRTLTVSLDELAHGDVHEVPGGPGHLRLQPGVGGLIGTGHGELTIEWTDPTPAEEGEAVFYYARVFQTDGEMAWTSPIWVG